MIKKIFRKNTILKLSSFEFSYRYYCLLLLHYKTVESMLNITSFLIVFIIALVIGIFIGKLLYSARYQTEKISLEEKSIALNSQLTLLKEQLEKDKSSFEKQLLDINNDRESIRNEKIA